MSDQTKWSDLLQAAVTEPGLMLKAYSAFHGYSLSNQVAAMIQCQQRGEHQVHHVNHLLPGLFR